MMSKEIIETAYEEWIESAEYSAESALESGTLKKEETSLMSFVEEKNLNDASDFITHIAYSAERDGFEQGFRRGIMFMMDIMRGRVGCNA